MISYTENDKIKYISNCRVCMRRYGCTEQEEWECNNKDFINFTLDECQLKYIKEKLSKEAQA